MFKKSMNLFFISVATLFLCSSWASNKDSAMTEPTQRIQPCDPRVEIPEFVPVPKDQGIKCGDNRLSEYVSSCGKYTGSSGCDYGDPRPVSTISCAKSREVCDGKNLDQMTCKKLGFFGGQLSCDFSCQSFDVSSCQVCRGDSSTKCMTIDLPNELFQMFASKIPEPHMIETKDGISLAWEYFDADSQKITLVNITRSGKFYITDKKKLTGFVGAKFPRLATQAERLVLVADRDSRLLVQDFDLTGNPKNEMFSVKGLDLSSLSLNDDLIEINPLSRDQRIPWQVYVDLRQKKIVEIPVPTEKGAPPREVSPISKMQLRRKSKLSALSTSSLLEHRFNIYSGEHEFEGAFIESRNAPSTINYKTASKKHPVLVKNGQLVIAIRKVKN